MQNSEIDTKEINCAVKSEEEGSEGKSDANNDVKFCTGKVPEIENNTSISPYAMNYGSDCTDELSAGAKDFGTQSEMVVQNQSNKKENHFKCDFCSYSCRNEIRLTRHMLKHAGEKPYKCDFCSYSCTKNCIFYYNYSCRDHTYMVFLQHALAYVVLIYFDNDNYSYRNHT